MYVHVHSVVYIVLKIAELESKLLCVKFTRISCVIFCKCFHQNLATVLAYICNLGTSLHPQSVPHESGCGCMAHVPSGHYNIPRSLHFIC